MFVTIPGTQLIYKKSFGLAVGIFKSKTHHFRMVPFAQSPTGLVRWGLGTYGDGPSRFAVTQPY